MRELVLYVVFCVLTTLVNFVVYFPIYYALGSDWEVRLFGLVTLKSYAVASVIAWLAAVAFAYVTNKLLVFGSRSWEKRVVAREALSFYAARLFSLGVELLGLYVMNDLMGFGRFNWAALGREINGEDVSKLLMQFVVIVLNYVFSKLWIFTKTKGER
jgi:putative flippase GtrA